MSPTDIFVQRAEQLSRELEQSHTGNQLVVFQLGGQRFGCELKFIRELVEIVDCTGIPGAPPWLLGLINLRGRVLSLVDICPLLHLSQGPPPARKVALVVSHPTLFLAIRIDALEGIVTFDPAELRPVAGRDSGLPLGDRLVDGQGLVTTLDMDRLLNEEALIVNQAPGDQN